MQRVDHDVWHPLDAPPPEAPKPPSRAIMLLKRVTTSTTMIMTVITALVLVCVANVDFGKGKPPPGTADISTNELMQTLSGQQMDPMVAQAESNAKERAYKKQLELEKIARHKAKVAAAKRAEAERKRREQAAFEALKKRMSNDPSAAQNQAYAKHMNELRGWGRCWGSLLTMWNHESGWNEHASNPGTGAYGIPQALPGSKMSSAGPDWRNNAMTQIAWGLSYVGARYGDPCRAWGFWQAHRWY